MAKSKATLNSPKEEREKEKEREREEKIRYKVCPVWDTN